ncbi:hypothetical protein FRC02_010108 [Tulasnella sp. 418]|nr:hypothetical protein FRC02_010108 [Tulasnella sp. 418]
MADAAALDPAVVAMLKEAAYYIRGSQIFFSALYAVCLWDWLISLKREYHLIWKKRWSVVKVLYILCRYWVIIIMPYVLWVFIEDHSEEACFKLYRSPVALAMWNQLWSEGVLLIRTNAFLGNKIQVLIPLCLMLAGVVAYQLYVDISQMTLLPFINPPNGPCFPTVRYTGSAHVMGFFLAPLIFDTILTVLTVWQGWQHWKQSKTGSPLLKSFLQDGIFYFFLISAANLVNAIFYFQPKQVMSALLIPMSVIFPDILACRMILGLRSSAFGYNSTDGATTGQSFSHSQRRVPVQVSNAKHGDGSKFGLSGKATPTPGVISNMGFSHTVNHEMDTFHTVDVEMRDDIYDNSQDDVKPTPYNGSQVTIETTTTKQVHTGRPRTGEKEPTSPRGGIRIDIERHAYYEEDGSDKNSSKSKDKSFLGM